MFRVSKRRFDRCRSLSIRSGFAEPPSIRIDVAADAELLESRQTFSFETTLAARSYASHIPDWKSKGYCISLFFLWLPTVELAIERVANRVRQGGHNIMEHTIRQRYERGLLNFHNLYRPLVDEWMFLDGSALPPQEVARCREDRLAVTDPGVWEQFQDQAVGNRRNNDDRSDIE